jgi:uncharacterized lipoprotein YmbA
MRRCFLVAVLLLAACGSPDAEALSAENQYEIIEQANGSDTEKCVAAGRVADAWLKRENKDEYERWKLTRDVYCDLPRLRD